MPILPRRFNRLKSVLNSRMGDLTVVLEEVEKPHNLSAILRSCDAVGALEAHVVSRENKTPTFNSTAQGSQKWVKLNQHKDIQSIVYELKKRKFKLFGTSLDIGAVDYRKFDFCGPTAFVLGAEKWGLTDTAKKLMDAEIFIPMRGMVQSLNVSVAAATLLFEALRQRDFSKVLPQSGEGISKELYAQLIFEWAYPEVASWCNEQGREYPSLSEKGEIEEDLPRNLKLRC